MPISMTADFKTLRKKTKKHFLKNVIDIWYHVHQHVGDTPALSRFSPVWGNNFTILHQVEVMVGFG